MEEIYHLGHYHNFFPNKVEKILKGSLTLVPSPSVKIQIMGKKVCLGCKGFENKKFVDITQQRFVLKPQVNFPANNLNFHKK